MYKINSVKITGFWKRFDVFCDFSEKVSIVIGKNGSGKTTFMNILKAVLSVDLDEMSGNEFDSVLIKLVDGKRTKTIKATKIEDEKYPFLRLDYQISQKKFSLQFLPQESKRGSTAYYRKRALEESIEVKNALSEFVALSSISVYRLRSGDEFEVRERRDIRMMSPVDLRLSELLGKLTQYQLSLSQRARQIASKLQKDVLASILYSEEDADNKGFELDFDKGKEKEGLVSAYTHLNAIDSEIKRKIGFHVSSISKTLDLLKSYDPEDDRPFNIDFRCLEALRKTRKIIDMSLEAEKNTEKIFSQIKLYLNTIQSFIEDKKFDFEAESGNLIVYNNQEAVDHSRLSSGEKQLLILLTESLLQNQKPHVFLADEPELSLHIAWQRNIIPAITKLNPNAQVIAATHSPEIASKYSDSIFDMEDMISAQA
ncbi:AAA family ATPase [Nodosilinea nodulosa]|uniref:AAA family ATPase n=1 Tax=Nodosilinea nodulosa TaxID=416001 RepID=UPI0002EFC9F2|nr:AAA family ATPase [Nodosilinea nodulosa]